MAKITKAVSLKNAEINMEDMTITETTKDDIKVYSLDKLLADWNHISVSLLRLSRTMIFLPMNKRKGGGRY